LCCIRRQTLLAHCLYRGQLKGKIPKAEKARLLARYRCKVAKKHIGKEEGISRETWGHPSFEGIRTGKESTMAV